MSDETNPREELYNRFKESLHQPVTDRFFDEDELVEIYDYAGDISDDYVQLEVLFCGARLYPESVALSERRALMYVDTSIDDTNAPSPAGAAYLADNPSTQTVLFDIARLSVTRPENAESALEYLLEQYNDFGDEEIIRFVDLAFDLDCYEWVIVNMPRLRAKVKYLPPLLFEVMQEADETLDNETAASLAEELIETEPFAAGYWTILFRAQARAGKEDEARTSFDYAKALAGDNCELLLEIADTVYNYAPYLYQEAYDILEALKTESPDEFIYVDCQCAILARAGAGARAIDNLCRYLDSHPDNTRAMRQLMVCNMPGVGEYLDRFYMATGGEGFDSATFGELATTLSMNGAAHSLIALMEHRNTDAELEVNEMTDWVEAMFALGKYSKICELLDGYPHKTDFVAMPLKGSSAIFSYLVSLMKMHRGDDAEAFLASVRPNLESLIEESPMPVRMTVRTIFTLADKMRQHPADDFLYWDAFDMLNYGKR